MSLLNRNLLGKFHAIPIALNFMRIYMGIENYNTETEKAYQKEKTTKLILSIALDCVGMLTFLAPGIGEVLDFGWAPIAAVANFLMFRGVTGAAGGVGTFLEELLPGADWIPSFTITWGIKYIVKENQTIADFVKRHRERKSLLAD
jgi:hypothetical protein